MIDAIDCGGGIIALFMDFHKAFDSVWKKLMLKKLKALGIEGKEYNWFKSYLENRLQFVEITYVNDKKNFIRKFVSTLKKILFGVPQGSILGPLLFIIYLIGIPEFKKLCLYVK